MNFLVRASGLAATAFAIILLGAADSAQRAEKLTDPQIAQVAFTAGEIDIKSAKLALEKSKNAEVRSFAEDMVRDHKAVNDEVSALGKKLKITLANSDFNKSLLKDADEKHAALAKLTGSSFDQAYADNEVAYHKAVNGALEKTLIPSAQNSELKELLEAGLKIFQSHEEHAEQLSHSLQAGG